MMNIFEEVYRGIQEAKKAYAAAASTAEQDAARAIYKQATAKLDGLSNTEQRIWNAYETAKDYGIDGGRISKLMLKRNGEIAYNYDRGPDIEPVDEETEMALAILMKEYN